MPESHYPECSYSPVQPGFGGINSGIPSTQPYIPGSPCICPALRACEQRVREEESRNVIGSVSLAAIGEANVQQYHLGYAAGLSAARDAVAFHEPVDYGQKYGVKHGEGRMVCDYCDSLNWSTEGLDQKDDIDWPCPTVAALDALRGDA